MRKVEGIDVQWSQYTNHLGVGYGPWYAKDRKGTIIGAVNQCVGDISHLWLTSIYRPKDRNDKLQAYTWSEARAKYFVESWAKYHLPNVRTDQENR